MNEHNLVLENTVFSMILLLTIHNMSTLCYVRMCETIYGFIE